MLSVGSNTVRLLVAEDVDGELRPIAHHARGTRLGAGLDARRALSDEAIDRTLATCAEFAQIARASGADLGAIATSAVRRATNGAAFAAALRARCGVALEIVSGECEARYGFAGATARDRPRGRVAMLDIGGGSTEGAVGGPDGLDRAHSCEIGTVRLTERFAALAGGSPGEPARRAAREARVVADAALAPLRTLGPVAEVRAVAGTPCTLAALVRGAEDDVRGCELTTAVVAAQLDRLSDRDLAARRALPGMHAQRADVMAAGAVLLLSALAAFDCDRARVETDDLLLGYLLTTRPT